MRLIKSTQCNDSFHQKLTYANEIVLEVLIAFDTLHKKAYFIYDIDNTFLYKQQIVIWL